MDDWKQEEQEEKVAGSKAAPEDAVQYGVLGNCVPCEGDSGRLLNILIDPIPLGAISALGSVAHVSAGGCSPRQACIVIEAGGDTPGQETLHSVTTPGGGIQQLEQCAHVRRTQGSRRSDDTYEAAFQGQQNGDTAAEWGEAGPAVRGCYTSIQGNEEGDISLVVDMDDLDEEVLEDSDC